MKTGYQIYVKRDGENTFTACSLYNWFASEQDAIKRLGDLKRTWEKYGNEYIVVKLG